MAMDMLGAARALAAATEPAKQRGRLRRRGSTCRVGCRCVGRTGALAARFVPYDGAGPRRVMACDACNICHGVARGGFARIALCAMACAGVDHRSATHRVGLRLSGPRLPDRHRLVVDTRPFGQRTWEQSLPRAVPPGSSLAWNAGADDRRDDPSADRSWTRMDAVAARNRLRSCRPLGRRGGFDGAAHRGDACAHRGDCRLAAQRSSADVGDRQAVAHRRRSPAGSAGLLMRAMLAPIGVIAALLLNVRQLTSEIGKLWLIVGAAWFFFLRGTPLTERFAQSGSSIGSLVRYVRPLLFVVG